jgi:hypothetical protein
MRDPSDHDQGWSGYWEHEGATYAVHLVLRPVFGRYECVRFVIEALTPERGRVSGPVLDRVPLASLLTGALTDLRSAAVAAKITEPQPYDLLAGELQPSEEFIARRDAWWAEAKTEATDVVLPTLAATDEMNTGRRWPADHLERVAEVYRRAYLNRQPPTKAVAEAFGITRELAARHVARARKKRLLEPTTRGRIGRPI